MPAIIWLDVFFAFQQLGDILINSNTSWKMFDCIIHCTEPAHFIAVCLFETNDVEVYNRLKLHCLGDDMTSFFLAIHRLLL
jgi:hypothetical protein